MFKIIITIILTVLSVIFIIQNFDHVPIYFFWGKAIKIRLIFVITISGAIGYIIRLFIGIAKEERLKKKINFMRRQLDRKIKIDDVEEEFAHEDLPIKQ